MKQVVEINNWQDRFKLKVFLVFVVGGCKEKKSCIYVQILDYFEAFGCMQRKFKLCLKRSLSEDGLNWRYNIHFTRCWSRSCKSHNFMAIVEVKDTHTSFLMYGYNYYQANLIIRRCAKSAINILEQKSKKCEVKQYVL